MAAQRKALSKKTRFEVFKRDGFVCQYCGAHPPEAILECDHITPVAAGGGNDIDNLVTACFTCNRGKAANSLDTVPASLAEKAAQIAETEAQLQGFQKIMGAKRSRLDEESWKLMNMLVREQDSAPRDWFNSMRMFVEKLGYYEALNAMDVTLAKGIYPEQKEWRYFCGVCWNKLRKQGEASA